MYDPAVRNDACARMVRGESFRQVSHSTGIDQFVLRNWYYGPKRDSRREPCPRCASPPQLPEPGRDYAYLLGLYQGDGWISFSGDPAKNVWVLRIACADAWRGLLDECIAAVAAIRPANKVNTVQSDGCKVVVAASRHWPCLFPQHGPGRKHNRKIELA